MIEIKNIDLFHKIVAEEIASVNGNRSLTSGEIVRFVNALAKATARIESRGAFMDFDQKADKLLIWSDSNEIYEVNGDKTCVCKASQNGNVCWHRAAKRLVSRYVLAEQTIKQPIASHDCGSGRFRQTVWGSKERCQRCTAEEARIQVARARMSIN